MLKAILSIAALMSAGASVAHAGPAVPSPFAYGIEQSDVLHIAARAQKPAQRHARALKGNTRVVKDTCPGGDKKCIKDLIAACDKAGGGLSTQPDGGVDCYVVGIHDQP